MVIYAFIVVYVGLAYLYSTFLIFILTDFSTFYPAFTLTIFLENSAAHFKSVFYTYQNTLHFPNSKTFFKKSDDFF